MAMLAGLSLNWVLSDDGKTLFGPAQLALLQQSKASIVRVDLRLGHVPSWTPDLIDAYSAILDQIALAGIQIIGLLGPGIVSGPTQQQWNANPMELGGIGTNDWIQQYVAAAQYLVQALPQLSYVEIWNEPNAWTSHTDKVYTGGSYIYPSLYADILNTVYPLIKATHSDVPVITGGLLAHNNHGALTRANAGADYLDQLYQWVALGDMPFDLIGYHLYLDQGGAAVAEHIQRYLNWVLMVIAANEGDSVDRGVIVTECGWSTKAMAQTQQASNLQTLYSLLANNRYVQTACNFQLQDNPAGSQFYGLYDVGGKPKAALATFATFQEAG